MLSRHMRTQVRRITEAADRPRLTFFRRSTKVLHRCLLGDESVRCYANGLNHWISSANIRGNPKSLVWVLLPSTSNRSYSNGRGRSVPPGGTHRMDLGGGEEESALEKYGVDLTERARAGKLDPVIGRDAEIHRFVFPNILVAPRVCSVL
jgi:ATP-dependent Clp protease ATP-binding subunit ClpA